MMQFWNTIILLRLDDEGGSEDVYKHPVTVKAEYDPKVSHYLRWVLSKAIARPTLLGLHEPPPQAKDVAHNLSPQGMLVKVLEDSEQKEFVVSQGSEFARVGRKGIIFKVTFMRILVV